MLLYLLIFGFLCALCNGQLEQFQQTFDYVTVREGAHMFYWLFYTTASVTNYTERPLIVWLQGGPGGSSTGIGNFEIMGPLDLNLQERNYTWVKDFNVMYLDNPVGSGYSYVDNLEFLTVTNNEIAADFVNVLRGFYEKNPEFEEVPLYIVGQSYGGKMAVDMALHVVEAEREGTLRSNLQGIAMGNAWIHPVNLTSTWGPLLLAAGLIDQQGYQNIQAMAKRAEDAFYAGQFGESTTLWRATQREVFDAAEYIDFYNILSKEPAYTPDLRTKKEDIQDNLLRYAIRDNSNPSKEFQYNTNDLMNGPVRDFLGIIPDNVTWGTQSNAVFNYLSDDFMLPVTHGIERLLNETDVTVLKYNGNLDLICDTPGQLMWVDRLRWPEAAEYRNSPRQPLWVDNKLEGYYKSHGNFKFYWLNVAGHSAPRDNPPGSRAFLRDLTGV